MPAEHLRALMAQYQPGVSARQVAILAGMGEHTIAYYFRPTTDLKHVPDKKQCQEIAAAFGCHWYEVVEAFNHDLGMPWGPPLDDPEEARLLRTYRRLSEADRVTLLRVADSLAGGA